MLPFLRDFIQSIGRIVDVILLDEDGLGAPRRYRVQASRVLGAVLGFSVIVALTLTLIVVATPVRGLFPGLSTAEMQSQARLNALRLSALEDSLVSQQGYMNRVRDIMMGRVSPDAARLAPAADLSDDDGLDQPPLDPSSEDWEDHQQPAFPIGRFSAEGGGILPVAVGSIPAVSLPRFPVLPPVDGFATRGFNPRIGHYALDLAVTEGTIVRSISDGYVVLADWTHDGGYVITVQHSGGYLSVYKHNQRLLKRVGDRVTAREPIARSGNTGEVTTGPHLHFELWRDGLAQDPVGFLLSL